MDTSLQSKQMINYGSTSSSLSASLLPPYEEMHNSPFAPSRTSCWQRTMEGLFDFFTFVVFTADVTLDILITLQFYELQRMSFFWISIALFFCSQVAYSALFVMVFAGGKTRRVHVGVFLCIFPLAQFVPYILFAHSFHWHWMDELIRKLRLDLLPVNHFDPEKDPLKQFVQAKIQQHGGFMAEALVEALPQSILQVVALVITDDVTSLLAISSIVMSMVSLASRGMILSYSLDLWTRIFNIWGFVLDVFSLFTTVLWLFFTVQGQELVPVFPGLWEQPVSIVSAWWIYKESVLVSLWFCVGVGLFSYIAYSIWETDFSGLCVIFVLGLVMFVPAMVVLEGSRFWLLAIFLSGSEESLMSHNHKLFKWVFWFLKTTHKIDGVEVDPGFMEKHRLINRTIVRQRLRVDVTSVRMLEVTAHKSTYSYAALREVHNVKGHFIHFFTSLLKRGTDSKRPSGLEPFVFVIFRYLFVFLVLPYTVLSSLLSLAFPVVVFCLTPFEDIPLLQRVMSFAYFGLLVVWLLLGIKASQFLWLRAHIFDMQLLYDLDGRFRGDLTHAFDNLRGSAMTQRLLPLPTVLSDMVVRYAFDENDN